MGAKHPKVVQLSQSRLFRGGLNEFKDQVVITHKNKASGGFGSVHEGLLNPKQKKIAIKEYKDDIQIEDVERELKNLDKIDGICPYIIRCIGIYAWVNQNGIEERVKVVIIFPLAKSDVYKMCQHGTKFSEQEVEKMLEHVLQGLRFLKKSIGMIHRDIKPQNILKMEDGTYCITDFGISKVVERKQDSNTITATKLKTKNVEELSLFYAAPEILTLCEQQAQQDVDTQVESVDILKGDIFSLGITGLQVAFNLKTAEIKDMNGPQGESLRNPWLEQIQRQKLRETLKGMLQQRAADRFDIEQSISCLMVGTKSVVQSQQISTVTPSEQSPLQQIVVRNSIAQQIPQEIVPNDQMNQSQLNSQKLSPTNNSQTESEVQREKRLRDERAQQQEQRKFQKAMALNGPIKMKEWDNKRGDKAKRASDLRYFMFDPEGVFLVYYKTKGLPKPDDEPAGYYFLLNIKVEHKEYKDKFILLLTDYQQRYQIELQDKLQNTMKSWLLTFEQKKQKEDWFQAITELQKRLIEREKDDYSIKRLAKAYQTNEDTTLLEEYRTVCEKLKLQSEERDETLQKRNMEANRRILRYLGFEDFLDQHEDQQQMYFYYGFLYCERSDNVTQQLSQELKRSWYFLISEIPLTKEYAHKDVWDLRHELMQPENVFAGMELNVLYEYQIDDKILAGEMCKAELVDKFYIEDMESFQEPFVQLAQDSIEEGKIDPLSTGKKAFKEAGKFIVNGFLHLQNVGISINSENLRYQIKFKYFDSQDDSLEINMALKSSSLQQSKNWSTNLQRIKEWTTKKTIKILQQKQQIQDRQQCAEIRKQQKNNQLHQGQDKEQQENLNDENDYEEDIFEENQSIVFQFKENIKTQIVFMDLYQVNISKIAQSSASSTSYNPLKAANKFYDSVVNKKQSTDQIVEEQIQQQQQFQMLVVRRDCIQIFKREKVDRCPIHSIILDKIQEIKNESEQQLIISYCGNEYQQQKTKREYFQIVINFESNKERDFFKQLLARVVSDRNEIKIPLLEFFPDDQNLEFTEINQVIRQMHKTGIFEMKGCNREQLKPLEELRLRKYVKLNTNISQEQEEKTVKNSVFIVQK